MATTVMTATTAETSVSPSPQTGMLSFGDLPLYLKHGGAPWGKDLGATRYADRELWASQVGDLEPPGGEGPGWAPWEAFAPRGVVAETLGEDAVSYVVRKWEREGPRGLRMRVEYWQAKKDYICAARVGGWFLVVGCAAGHPFVHTPSASWSATDGRTTPRPLDPSSPGALLATAAKAARRFLDGQAC